MAMIRVALLALCFVQLSAGAPTGLAWNVAPARGSGAGPAPVPSFLRQAAAGSNAGVMPPQPSKAGADSDVMPPPSVLPLGADVPVPNDQMSTQRMFNPYPSLDDDDNMTMSFDDSHNSMSNDTPSNDDSHIPFSRDSMSKKVFNMSSFDPSQYHFSHDDHGSVSHDGHDSLSHDGDQMSSHDDHRIPFSHDDHDSNSHDGDHMSSHDDHRIPFSHDDHRIPFSHDDHDSNSHDDDHLSSHDARRIPFSHEDYDSKSHGGDHSSSEDDKKPTADRRQVRTMIQTAIDLLKKKRARMDGSDESSESHDNVAPAPSRRHFEEHRRARMDGSDESSESNDNVAPAPRRGRFDDKEHRDVRPIDRFDNEVHGPEPSGHHFEEHHQVSSNGGRSIDEHLLTFSIGERHIEEHPRVEKHHHVQHASRTHQSDDALVENVLKQVFELEEPNHEEAGEDLAEEISRALESHKPNSAEDDAELEEIRTLQRERKLQPPIMPPRSQ